MKKTPSSIDPAVLALLREAADDPESKLLKVASTQISRGVLERESRVSSRAAMLTNLERHLLAQHREEVAYLLRAACVTLMHRQPTWKHRVHRSLTVHRVAEVPDRDAWRVRAEMAVQSHHQSGSDEADLAVLERCVSGTRARHPSLGELAIASLRLAPSDEARIYLALDLTAQSQLRSAEAAYRNVLAHRSSDLVASIAWENLSFVYWQERAFLPAAEACERASSAHSDRISPLWCELSCHLQLGDKRNALRVAECIDERVTDDHFAVQSFVATQSAARREGEWECTDAARQLVRTIADRLGPASRSIAHVFA